MRQRQENPKKRFLTPVRAARVADSVADQLSKLIGAGVFRAGERLPTEREIGEQVGVSRTSVRQAIQKLEVQGLLETTHGGGSKVRNVTEQEIKSPMQHVIGQDKLRFLELVELRSVMESWAARTAAKHRTATQLEAMRRYLDRMEKDFEKGRNRYELDVKLHAEIAAATQNTIYMHLLESIYSLIQYSMKLHREEVVFDREGQAKILKQHKAIYETILNRNPEAAEAAMKEHLDFVLEGFRRYSSF